MATKMKNDLQGAARLFDWDPMSGAGISETVAA